MTMMKVECKLCGVRFETERKSNHARYCDECRKAIFGSNREERKDAFTKAVKRSQSRIDALAAMAREYGVSYGKFVALRASGYFIGLTPGAEPYKNLEHEEWQKELLSIAERGGRSRGI